MTPYLLLLGILLFGACERRHLESESPDPGLSALIPVKIDWSKTGFPVDATPRLATQQEYVHRVSLRFFPRNGGAPFERYLETNVFEGEINVPVGEYAVIVYNESVEDVNYWNGRVVFSHPNDFKAFSASLSQDPTSYDFYTPGASEFMGVEPLRLASWSLDTFWVTPEMATKTRYQTTRTLVMQDQQMLYALTHIVMRPLTYPTQIKADLHNLRSAQQIRGCLRGFASRVNMATGKTHAESGNHVIPFTTRAWWSTEQKDGSATALLLTLGRSTPAAKSASEKYDIHMDVVLHNGQRHSMSQPVFDLSDQILASTDTLKANIAFDLPEYSGSDIEIDPWREESTLIY
ncbi:MAG: DUF5119 domain-containing protein [Alistipes sp.]|nr:DUF5119 domain-containing protein [Alistipes sp.]